MDQHAGQTGNPQGERPLGNHPGETDAGAGLAQGGIRLVPPVPPLKAAIRRARVENAEQSEALDIVHGAEIARLEFLQDALAPVLDEIPDNVDLFDVSLSTGSHPRLFIDMIAFVEMGHDKRLYRFLQDTRHGRVTVAEHEKIGVIVDAVTTYIARRLVEREKLLATLETPAQQPAPKLMESTPAETPSEPVPAMAHGFKDVVRFCVDLLGSMALFVLIAAGCYFVLTWWAANGPSWKF